MTSSQCIWVKEPSTMPLQNSRYILISASRRYGRISFPYRVKIKYKGKVEKELGLYTMLISASNDAKKYAIDNHIQTIVYPDRSRYGWRVARKSNR